MLAGISIALGVSVATAMIAVATDIGDKINRELRTYGANMVVYPQEDSLDVEVGGVNLKPASEGAFLKESDLAAMKVGFWKHNIVGYFAATSGYLDVNGSRRRTHRHILQQADSRRPRGRLPYRRHHYKSLVESERCMACRRFHRHSRRRETSSIALMSAPALPFRSRAAN